MNNVLYHSSYGGTLVFEPNDSLEHASRDEIKRKVAERYNSNRDPGMYGQKNTGRDKYTGLFQAGEAAKERQAERNAQKQIQEARDEAAGYVKKLCDGMVDLVKTKGSLDYCNKIIDKKDSLELSLEAKGVNGGFYRVSF